MPGLHHQVRNARGRSWWLCQWYHFKLHPKRSKWNEQDVRSEWVTRVGTEVQKLLFVDDVVKNVTSAPWSAYMSCSSCAQFFVLVQTKKKKIKTKHSSSVSPLNENSLLQQKMYGCCCWCGRWDFPHHSKPWLKHVNSVSLIAVKHQREAWKISVIFDPLPILQQMALQQHSVAWAAGPIRAAKTA